MLETVLQYGTASRRARRIRRRQDRHDLQLRRRLVRRLGPQVHGRRVGRLPQQPGADDHRLRRRPGARRHLPGADLARLHDLGAAHRQDPRRTGGGAGRRPAAGARPRAVQPIDDQPLRRNRAPSGGRLRERRSGRRSSAERHASPNTGGNEHSSSPAAPAPVLTADSCHPQPSGKRASTQRRRRRELGSHRRSQRQPIEEGSGVYATARRKGLRVVCPRTRAGDVAVAGHAEPPWQLDGLGDPDPRADHHPAFPPSSRGPILTGPARRSPPFSDSPMPSAWVSLPGPEHSSVSPEALERRVDGRDPCSGGVERTTRAHLLDSLERLAAP